MKNDLREAAIQARLRAYVPDSRFLVGAALRLKSCLVVSTCVGRAIEQGEREFQPIVVVAGTETPALGGKSQEFSLTNLLPSLKQGILEVPRGT